MKIIVTSAILALAAASSGCDSDEVPETDQHVWEDQVEAIDKAREVEDVLKRAAEAQDDATEQ